MLPQRVIRVGPWHSSKLQRWFHTLRVGELKYSWNFAHYFSGVASLCHLGIIQPGELVPLLPGDHEGGQVGGVDGEENHGEQRPDRRHEPEQEQRGVKNVDYCGTATI